MSKRCSGSYAKSASRGLLGDLLGKSGGTKGMKIGIMSKRKNDSALEKGHIKHTGRCWEFQGMDNLTSEMRNSSNCTSW